MTLKNVLSSTRPLLDRCLVLRRSLSTSQIKYVTQSKLTAQQAGSAAAGSSSQQVVPPPHMDGQAKAYAPKIQQLVDQISQLNLIEVADLNELLRIKLNIKDVAMSYGAGAPAVNASASAAATAAAKAAEEEAEQAPKATKSSFKLKLIKYDEAKKVALIKEVKALGNNLNLVQAKKFIESLPQTFRDDVSKEEAEKLKAQLEKVGAVCEID